MDEQEEKIWEGFFKEYLARVVAILPESHRAQQLKSGDYLQVALVHKFETDFLKKPLMNALKSFSVQKKEEFKELTKKSLPCMYKAGECDGSCYFCLSREAMLRAIDETDRWEIKL